MAVWAHCADVTVSQMKVTMAISDETMMTCPGILEGTSFATLGGEMEV